MDIAASLEALGVDRDSYRVIALLPLVYVAWADGKVQARERAAILRIAEERGWLAGKGRAILDGWLAEAPSEAQLAAGIALLNHLARERGELADSLDADDLHLLLLHCKDVAEAAGGFFGLREAQSAEELSALEAIAGTLDIKSAKRWRALTKTDDPG